MSKVIIIVLIALGTACGLLMARPLLLARWLWPGPTVKGPGDVYVQAFQALACLIALGRFSHVLDEAPRACTNLPRPVRNSRVLYVSPTSCTKLPRPVRFSHVPGASPTSCTRRPRPGQGAPTSAGPAKAGADRPCRGSLARVHWISPAMRERRARGRLRRQRHAQHRRLHLLPDAVCAGVLSREAARFALPRGMTPGPSVARLRFRQESMRLYRNPPTGRAAFLTPSRAARRETSSGLLWARRSSWPSDCPGRTIPLLILDKAGCHLRACEK